MDELRIRNPTATVCETCAERGRPNEPVYKLGMCEFCYKGLRHPKATREQLAKERSEDALMVGLCPLLSLTREQLAKERSGQRPTMSASSPEKRRLEHRSEEHTSELQSLRHLVCRLLLEKK